ncbi:MAG: hypothetical protein KF847_13175 [Pirellulales bacterium]|nr:hypothetical protein [Pirellulales bacterium]
MTDRLWFIAQRRLQFEGEARANVLRLVAIGVFYLIHLGSYLASEGKLPRWDLLQLAESGEIDRRFHLLVTLLAGSWAAAAAAVHLLLTQRVFPRWISQATTIVDLLMLTSLLAISRGPQSPLVVGYFLVIALAALRFSLPLVWTAAGGAIAGYVCLLGVAKWPLAFGRPADLDMNVPRYEQLIMLAALAVAGAVTGQVVRRVRSLVRRVDVRLGNAEGAS